MANYLKGIGDAGTRVNEIPPSLDARINQFLLGHTAGIIKPEFNEFSATKIDRGVIISGGLMQAHGYFGCSDTETVINFVMPTTTNYVQIFAEIDLSVVPNRFEVKASTMSNSTAYTFRQDNLRTASNGKYQLPLWQVTLTSTTITLVDKRAVIEKPLNAVNSEVAVRLSGSIDSDVTAVKQAQTDNSTKVATTSYVRQAISDAKNIIQESMGIPYSVTVEKNEIKRQLNFVIGELNYLNLLMPSGTIPIGSVVGTIPTGLRSKTAIQLRGGNLYVHPNLEQKKKCIEKMSKDLYC